MSGEERVGAVTRVVEVQRSDVELHHGTSGRRRQRGEASQPHEVVGRADQIAGEVNALQAAEARLAEPSHCFHPAEDFFDSPCRHPGSSGESRARERPRSSAVPHPAPPCRWRW